MRSSTSSSRYLWIFLATSTLVVAPVYAHYLIYSPPVRDLFERTTLSADEYYGRIGPATTVFYRSECLAENIVDPARLGRRDHLMTRDDSPWELVEFLESSSVTPREVVVFEDTTFFLFYREAGRASRVVQQIRESQRRADVVDTLREYLVALEEGRVREQRRFAIRLQTTESIVLSPALLRQYASEYLDRLGRRVVPSRSRHTTHIESFWRRHYLNYYATGDPGYLMQAFSAHRSHFVSPGFQSWLARSFMEMEEFGNAAAPDDFDPLGRSLADGYPRSAADEASYPAIEALKRATRRGTRVRVVVLPSNPNYERRSLAALEPYYEALRGVCRRNGWPLADLRSLNTPQLREFGVFRDQMHLWHERNIEYFEAVARLIREEMAQSGEPGSPR